MKKQCLIVLATVATMVIGLGSLALAQSRVVTQVPGNTVVQDPAGDFLLRKCDPVHPDTPCSLPPGASLYLPGYLDIKTARITEIGRGLVDLSIALYAPIPLEPPYGFVSYIWQFQGGCVTGEPGDKAAISIVWHEGTKTWSANWYVITKCDPREIDLGEPIADWKFTGNGVKVRVALDDLLEATNETETLIWHAAVRRVPFIYYIPPLGESGSTKITHTAAVDYAPDVVEFDQTIPEDFATWEPR